MMYQDRLADLVLKVAAARILSGYVIFRGVYAQRSPCIEGDAAPMASWDLVMPQ
jgi:hypothetical protein